MTQEALKLAEIIEHFDSNDESLPLELLKEISATLRALAQTQEPVGVVNIGDGGNWYFLPLVPTSELPKGTKFYTTPPQRTEQNFCPRCGKRTKDIHTCTPPQENT